MTQTARMEIGNGVFFDVLNPELDKISLYRIAHNLSNQNRFGGNPGRSISVAEHSYWASKMVVVPEGTDQWEANWLRLQALLHDATEAYLVDIPSPVKRLLPDYYKIEAGLAKAIGEKFGVELAQLSQPVKYVDAALCLTEKLAFLGKEGLDKPEWAPVTSIAKPIRHSFLPKWLDTMFGTIKREPTIYYHWYMTPRRARRLFVLRYIKLAGTMLLKP